MGTRIEVTEEQFQKVGTREGLEEVLNQVLAKAKVAFWEESHPTIVMMVEDCIPLLAAIEQYLKDKPHMWVPGLYATAFAIKSKNKNLTPFEVIDLAEKMLTGKQGGEKGEEVADVGGN